MNGSVNIIVPPTELVLPSVVFTLPITVFPINEYAAYCTPSPIVKFVQPGVQSFQCPIWTGLFVVPSPINIAWSVAS